MREVASAIVVVIAVALLAVLMVVTGVIGLVIVAAYAIAVSPILAVGWVVVLVLGGR